MKKYILSAAVAALSMISCQKELADPTQPDQAPVAGELVEMTFSASVETDDTKTYIDAADGFKAFWEASDKIAVYADAQKTEQPFAVTEGSASGTFAYFRGTAPEGASAYYAVYPAAAAGECADGKVNVTIPAVQTLSGHTTASGALVSVAKAEFPYADHTPSPPPIARKSRASSHSSARLSRMTTSVQAKRAGMSRAYLAYCTWVPMASLG